MFNLIIHILIVQVLCISTSLAQHEVKGILLDASTIDPIPFAVIGVPNSSIGTVSNLEGSFLLTTTTPVDSIVVSHLNYGTVKIKINVALDKIQDIQLNQKITVLKDVVVSNVPVNEILYQAVESSKNDLSSPLFLVTYYRRVC